MTEALAPDFTRHDQAERSWTLPDYLDTAAVLIAYRGDWRPSGNGQLVSLAQQHQRITAVGGRVGGISVDSPARNAAMVEKLGLPVPLLSDPGGERAIKPYGVWHEGHPFARPAVVTVAPDRQVRFRRVGEDFVDRLEEQEIVAALERLGLPATSQDPPTPGHDRGLPGFLTALSARRRGA